MNKKIIKLSLVVSLLAGAAFLQTAHAQAVDHSMHGGAASAGGEDHSMHDGGASAGGGDHSHGDAASAGGEDHSHGGGASAGGGDHSHGGGASAGGEDHGMHGGAASAGGEGNGKHHDGKGKGKGKGQNIVVRLGHFDAANWEDPFAGGHNWQPACMAVMMANHMLGEKNHVTLFLDLQGVELADTDNGSDLSGYACMMGTLQEGWDNLVNHGADIVVCPNCAVVGDVTEETLREGAHIADGPTEVSRIFLEADKVIDY